MRTRTSALLADLASAQHGVVTAAQLTQLHLDRRLPRRQGWPLLAPGTWSTTGHVDDQQLMEAARLYAGPEAVVSGALACRRYQLRDVPDAPCDVLVEHGRRLIGGGRLRLHQTRRLPDAVLVGGWPVAPLSRAVADACRWSPSLQAVRALALAAVGDGRTTASELSSELGAGPRRGSAHLARALSDAEGGARSAPEAEAADVLLGTAGLPRFLLNPELRLDGALVGLPDGYFPSLGLGWEADSLRHHGSSADLERTLGRHQRFVDAGVELLHVVPAALRRDPAGWAGSVADRARRRRGWQPPAGLTVVPHGPLLVPRSRPLAA